MVLHLSFDGMLTKGEYARAIINAENTNDERLQVEYIIDNETEN